GLTMKKSYIALGSIAVGAVAVSLVGMNINQDLKATFSHVKGELASSTPQDDGRVAVEEKVIAESDAGNIEVATAAIAPPTTPSPVIYNNAPQEGSKQKAARTQNYAAGAAMDMTARSSLTFGAPDVMPQQPQYFGRDTFEEIKENPVKVAKEEPVSTFSIDVDTSSYTFVRRSLNNGILPPKDAVRVEEMINYFDYDYPVPESREEPFKPTVAVYEAPWNADTMLMHIGIKGHEMPVDAEKPHANLVFLLDVSGSMNSQDKLPLLKNAFRMLVDTLQPDDTVAIVVYAGAAGTVLEPTKVSEKGKIFSALENLSAGGSTAGGEGIRQAYNLAEAHFDKDGVNRVILATDGDFNVGITDQNQLKDL
ncbi:MAG: vWA domain-containing protein, partial [Rickettsiales bacterium]